MRAPFRCFGVWIALLALCATASAQDNPDYVLSVGNVTTNPGGTATVPVLLDNNGDVIQGWSFGICHDEAALSVQSAALGSTTLTVKAGDPPDFEQINLEPGGWTMGVVICFTACEILPQGTGYELAVADYTALAPAVSNVSLTPCSTLGDPSINAVVVINGQSIPPVKTPGNVQILPLVSFIRGDANMDGFLDISDAIWLLNLLFQNGPEFDCQEAKDANGDGTFDTADPIYAVLYQFAGGLAPPPPFPNCGLLPNQSLEDCQVSPGCP